jgi:hypothetical protein
VEEELVRKGSVRMEGCAVEVSALKAREGERSEAEWSESIAACPVKGLI